MGKQKAAVVNKSLTKGFFVEHGLSQLHIAAIKGNTTQVRELLKQCKSRSKIDIQDDESGWTALHKAIYEGNLRIILLLIESGCSFEVRDREYNSPLDLLSLIIPMNPDFSKQGNHLYTWGSNSNYVLGHIDGVDRTSPERVESFLKGKKIDVIDVVICKFHTVILTSGGVVYTCGFGREGRLGHGNEESFLVPTKVNALSEHQCTIISANINHTLVLTSKGKIFGFGCNDDGQLGIDEANPQKKTPTNSIKVRKVVFEGKEVVGCVAGTKSSLFYTLKEIFYIGRNSGQLGSSKDNSPQLTPKKFSNFDEAKNIVQVVSNDESTVCLLDSKEVYVFCDFNCTKVMFPIVRAPRDIVCTRKSKFEISKLFVENGNGNKLAAVSNLGELYIWNKTSIPKLIWPVKKDELQICSVAIENDQVIFSTHSGHVYTFTLHLPKVNLKQDPKNPPKNLSKNELRNELRNESHTHYCQDYEFVQIFGLQRVLKVVVGRGSFGAIVQNAPLSQIKSEESTYFNDINSIWEDLRTPQSTDVIFEVEGEKIYCHKVILGARNKTLYSLFTNPKNSKMKSITFVGNHENHSVYEVQKWSKSSFLCILRKLYSEPYMHNDFEGQNLSEISQIASELKFQGTRAFYQLDPLSKSFSSLIEFYSDVPLFDSFTNVIINLQNGVQFLAHRVFLISRCNYFNAMIGIHSFWLETTQATPTVTLDHISWINFRVLIRYLYYDELNVLYDFDLENPTENMSFKKLNFLIEILSMSNEFLIDNLKNSCEKEISKFLDIKNVFEIYEVADTFEASSLKSACIELIFLNLEVLLISKSISSLGRKLILELEERMKAMTRGSHVSNFPFYCNSDDGTESDSGLSEDLNEVQEFNEFLNDEEIAMRLQFQFYNENNNRNSRANNSNRSRQNDNPPRNSPRNNSAKQKGKTKAKNNSKGKTPEKNSKVQKVENLEPIEDQIDVENMASSSSENHQNPVVNGGGKSPNKKNKKMNLEQVSNPTDDLESTNIESIENPFVCEVMESKSKIWASSTSQSKNQPISFREILETEMDKKKNTPKPPKPIISTPVKSLPQENKQNTSKNEGPWKKINPGTEPVQLTFLDELEAQEKLKNEAMKQQRLKELQIASSAKVKSSTTSSPWAITSPPKTVEVTKSPSFSQIQQQQHKDKVQKEKTLKKSFARIQAEEAALRELEKYYEKLAKEKGESFQITQTLND